MSGSLRGFQWVNLFEEDGWTRLLKSIQVGMERRGEATKPVVQESTLFEPYPAHERLSPGTEIAAPEEGLERIQFLRGVAGKKRWHFTGENLLWLSILLGIPVVLCLETVASVTLHSRSSQTQWEGLICFVLIILFYGLHSVGLHMLFEVGRRLTNQLRLPDSQRRALWQRYLVLRILALGPVTVFVVGTLLAVGISFENPSVQFLSWSLSPRTLIPLSFAGVGLVYAMIFAAAPRNVIMDEYPVVMPYYTAAMAAGFVGSLVVFFTFMN